MYVLKVVNTMPDGNLRKPTDWRNHGIRRVAGCDKSADTPVTQGMNRKVAISGQRTGSSALWAGTNLIKPGTTTGPHHHGHLESIIYIVRGHAIMRWGDRLEFITEAHAGDFFLVPPYVPHQEMNGSDTEDLHCVLVRSGTEEVIVNLDDIEVAEEPEWIRF
jgi:uncharacterized RmlC-like cupin family protein